MQNQQYFMNNNMMNGNGYAYSMNRPKAQNTQPVTPEMAAILKKESTLDMRIDQKDIWRAMCTHKDPTTHVSTLVQNADGTLTCSVCGKSFRFFEGGVEDVNAAVSTIIDVLQTTKTIYLDAPAKMIEQYYQVIPLLEKLPILWNMAVRNFDNYQGIDDMNPISNSYGSGFAAMNTMLTNPYAFGQQFGQPMMQQPMMGQPMPMGQPMMGYNPQMMQPMMGYNPQMMGQQPVADANNPMAYNAPVPGVMPAAPVAQAPAAPVTQGEVQQQKQMSV